MVYGGRVLNYFIDIQSSFIKDEHLKELLDFVLNIDFEIAEVAQNAINRTMLTSSILPNTLKAANKGWKNGEPIFFSGKSRIIDPVGYLTKELFNIVSIESQMAYKFASIEDTCIIHVICGCLSFMYLQAADYAQLRWAYEQHGEGAHERRINIIKQINEELYNNYKGKSLKTVFSEINNLTELCNKYSFSIIKDNSRLLYGYDIQKNHRRYYDYTFYCAAVEAYKMHYIQNLL